MTAAAQSNAALQPVLRLAITRRGFAAELCRQLARLGYPAKKQQIGLWLHVDERKRIQPGLGAGLLLLQAAEMAEREMNRRETRQVSHDAARSALPPTR